MSKDRFFSGGGQSEIDALESDVNDIEGHFISLNFTLHTNIPTTVVDNWSAFPQGIPFTGIIAASGIRSVQGYIYPGGNYGSVFIHGFDGMWFVRCYNGSFQKYYVQLNDVT